MRVPMKSLDRRSAFEAVPFDAAGDARIKGRFTLPGRCLAPAVLLNPLGRAGVFIAATGMVRHG